MRSSTLPRTVLCLANAGILPDSAEVTNFKTIYVPNLERAHAAMASTVVDALLVQLPVAGQVADELVRNLRMSLPGAPILVHEPNAADQKTFEPEREGICQYVAGPMPAKKLFETLSVAINGRNQSPSPSTDWWSGLVGASSVMRQVIEIIRLVAPRRSTVLITGDTGSGKEVAARAIHAASNRNGTRMVSVNCA